ncbi:hypothetical protein PR048_028318 [Dryococelus australis]|uniref:Uncharacterized protein n=1 Tax=Dryococelus australis TaxID=614101 RepID=A0ABQ9GIY7_9NEOP|nr:hypothetical protein PR048_028318 [Dryococelus australis]
MLLLPGDAFQLWWTRNSQPLCKIPLFNITNPDVSINVVPILGPKEEMTHYFELGMIMENKNSRYCYITDFSCQVSSQMTDYEHAINI